MTDRSALTGKQACLYPGSAAGMSGWIPESGKCVRAMCILHGCMAHAAVAPGSLRLTDDGKGQSIAKGSDLIGCAASVDLEDGHPYELC